jgi:hypothetical protein
MSDTNKIVDGVLEQWKYFLGQVSRRGLLYFFIDHWDRIWNPKLQQEALVLCNSLNVTKVGISHHILILRVLNHLYPNPRDADSFLSYYKGLAEFFRSQRRTQFIEDRLQHMKWFPFYFRRGCHVCVKIECLHIMDGRKTEFDKEYRAVATQLPVTIVKCQLGDFRDPHRPPVDSNGREVTYLHGLVPSAKFQSYWVGIVLPVMKLTDDLFQSRFAGNRNYLVPAFESQKQHGIAKKAYDTFCKCIKSTVSQVSRRVPDSNDGDENPLKRARIVKSPLEILVTHHGVVAYEQGIVNLIGSFLLVPVPK